MPKCMRVLKWIKLWDYCTKPWLSQLTYTTDSNILFSFVVQNRTFIVWTLSLKRFSRTDGLHLSTVKQAFYSESVERAPTNFRLRLKILLKRYVEPLSNTIHSEERNAQVTWCTMYEENGFGFLKEESARQQRAKNSREKKKGEGEKGAGGKADLLPVVKSRFPEVELNERRRQIRFCWLYPAFNVGMRCAAPRRNCFLPRGNDRRNSRQSNVANSWVWASSKRPAMAANTEIQW